MRGRGIATLVGGAALAGLAFWLFVDRHATPVAQVRFAGQAIDQNFADVPAATRWDLELTLDRPYQAYVFTHHPNEGAVCMYPTPWLRSDLPSPLPAGTHRLPGSHRGVEVSWPGPLSVGATDIVVLLSLEPVAELDAVRDRMRQANNSVFPDPASSVLSLPKGATNDDLAPRGNWPSALLAAAAATPSTDGTFRPLDDHPGVWHWSWRVVVREGAPLEEQLDEAFGPLKTGGGNDSGGASPSATPPRSGR